MHCIARVVSQGFALTIEAAKPLVRLPIRPVIVVCTSPSAEVVVARAAVPEPPEAEEADEMLSDEML